VHPNGRYSSRGRGAIDLLESLGYPRGSAAVARFVGLVERMYAFVAAHRDRLGHFVPDGPPPRRFP
jgi:hypothetical protein